VVIAIIGILASVVLIGLRGARDKAKDARIVADLAQIRAIAEVLYDGDYDELSLTQTDVAKLKDDITAQGGDLKLNKTAAPADAYCAYSKLNVKVGGATNFYCVDSTGVAGFTTTDPGAGTTCPAGTK